MKLKECNLIKIIWYKIKHSLDKKFIRVVTFVISKEFKRALFQYKGTQPLFCKKIRVDPMSVIKVKFDINLKSKKNKNTIDDPNLNTKSIKNVKYRINNKHKDFKEKNIANYLENCLKKVGDGFIQSINFLFLYLQTSIKTYLNLFFSQRISLLTWSHVLLN